MCGLETVKRKCNCKKKIDIEKSVVYHIISHVVQLVVHPHCFSPLPHVIFSENSEKKTKHKRLLLFTVM